VQQRLDRISGHRRLRHRHDARHPDRLPDPSAPPGTDRRPEIRHIVLLMMENHSFDNYLGTLGRGDGLPAPRPANPASDGAPAAVHHFASTRQHPSLPSQSWRASHLQYAEGRNDGFVRAVHDIDPAADGGIAMGYWDDSDLPFYAALARTFPLADRWFCSCLGPTFPNRRFLVAATANGLIDDVMPSVIDYPKTGTIFDLLNRYGIPWVNYHHVPPLRLFGRRAGGRGALRVARAAKLALGRCATDVNHRLRGDLQCTANLYPLGLTRTLGHLRHVDRFFAEAAAGTLPAVSIVDPDYLSCSEENPQDIRVGEGFAARVVEAVMHGRGWPHTLLIWFYDEHGGYYDHVPPPPAVEPDDVLPHSLLDAGGPLRWVLRHLPLWRSLRTQDAASGRYDRYGFRVPAVVVCPYARPDFVTSTVFDHTSAVKLIEEKWNLPPLTRRDAAATAPWEMLDFTAPPAFLDPPRLPPPARPWHG
jgi:phospholipase C